MRAAWAAVLLLLPLLAAAQPPPVEVRIVVVAGDARAFADAHGLALLDEAPAFSAALVAGPPAALAAAARDARALSLSANDRLALDLASATVATRAAELRGPHAIALGDGIVDGRGVGIAIVDTGIDATHPDLPLGTKVARNLRWAGVPVGPFGDLTDGGPVVFVDAPVTDATSGHGTHVAGIAAGTGEASGGAHAGVAPGATLYGLAAGDGVGMHRWAAVKAFEWILLNGPALDPPIRVISNSWGGRDGEPYREHEALSVAVRALVDAGMVVVFSAGNGGDGGLDMTNPECKDPTPGVLCVANYADAETGTREGAIHRTSSRGRAFVPSTWPDFAAPGTHVLAPRAAGAANAVSPQPEQGAPRYLALTGTSMAAPHAAGVAALVLQARPDLTPGEVEAILKETTYGPAANAPYPNRDAGAGLLDAQRAVESALSLPASPSLAPADGAARLAVALRARVAGASVDAGLGGVLATALARRVGLDAQPDTSVLPPNTREILVHAAFADAGETPLRGATVTARVEYLGSGRLFELTLSPSAIAGEYASAALPYEAADGDVRVVVAADRTADGPTPDDGTAERRYGAALRA